MMLNLSENLKVRMLKAPRLLLCGCLMTLSAFSQMKEETVVFKNGTRITGIPVTSKHPDSVSFLIYEPVIRTYSREDIAEISTNNPIRSSGSRPFAHKPGLFLGIDWGVLHGYDPDGDPLFGGAFRIQAGYAFKNNMEAGLHTGVEGIGGPLVPFQAFYTYVLPMDESALFGTIHTGYAVPLITEDNEWMEKRNFGGVALGADLGIRKNAGRSSHFYISGGYRFQRIHIEERWNPMWWSSTWIPEKDEENLKTTINLMHRFVLRVGFRFG